MLPLLALFQFALAQEPTCDLSAPSDAPFIVAAPTDDEGVAVILELRVGAGEEAWAQGVLDTLNRRGLHATIIVNLEKEVTPELSALLSGAKAAGHTLGLSIRSAQLSPDPERGPAALRKTMKPLKQAGGKFRAALAAVQGKAEEAVLARVGLRTLLISAGPATGVPRVLGHFEGQPDIGAAFSSGPYAGVCGTDPIADPFTPRAADRATQALHGAARSPGQAFIRVALVGGADDAIVLGRWIDEVLAPAKVPIWSAEEARLAARQLFRTGQGAAIDPRSTPAGRLVLRADVASAANQLSTQSALPRSVHDITLTELFQSFVYELVEVNEGGLLRIAPLNPPIQAPRLPTHGEISVPRAQVQALARAIYAERPETVPASMPVGGHLLSATDLLGLFASCVTGADPCVVTDLMPPEPNASGLGWGAAPSK